MVTHYLVILMLPPQRYVHIVSFLDDAPTHVLSTSDSE